MGLSSEIAGAAHHISHDFIIAQQKLIQDRKLLEI